MAVNQGASPSTSLGSATVTAVVSDPAPTLIIRQVPRIFQDATAITANINSLVQTVTSVASYLNENFAAMFKRESSKKQKPASKAATKANVRQVQLMLDNIREQLNGMMQRGVQHSIEEMSDVGDEQQEELVIFWQQIAELMNELLTWFDKLMENIVKKLVDGYHIDTAEMERIFEQAVHKLKHALREGHFPLFPPEFREQEDSPEKQQVPEVKPASQSHV